MKLPPHQMTLEEALRECDLPCWSVLPTVENKEFYEKAMEALLTRIRMADSRKIAITCSYGVEENGMLAEQLVNVLKRQEEKCQLLKWTPENQHDIVKQIEQYDISNGYLVVDCNSYHTNPEMPLISSKVDITLWNVVLNLSDLKSIDFINYSLKEGLVKKCALVLTDAHIDKKNQVNFGNFDYTPLTGLKAFIASVK